MQLEHIGKGKDEREGKHRPGIKYYQRNDYSYIEKKLQLWHFKKKEGGRRKKWTYREGVHVFFVLSERIGIFFIGSSHGRSAYRLDLSSSPFPSASASASCGFCFD